MRKYGIGEPSAIEQVSAPSYSGHRKLGAALPSVDLKVVAPLIWSWIHAKGHEKIVTFRVAFFTKTLYWDSPEVHFLAERILGTDTGA